LYGTQLLCSLPSRVSPDPLEFAGYGIAHSRHNKSRGLRPSSYLVLLGHAGSVYKVDLKGWFMWLCWEWQYDDLIDKMKKWNLWPRKSKMYIILRYDVACLVITIYSWDFPMRKRDINKKNLKLSQNLVSDNNHCFLPSSSFSKRNICGGLVITDPNTFYMR